MLSNIKLILQGVKSIHLFDLRNNDGTCLFILKINKNDFHYDIIHSRQKGCLFMCCE